MSLEPINFNKNLLKKKITKEVNQNKVIADMIFNITNIVVKIQKIKPPIIVLVVNNAPAASELNLQKNRILKDLSLKDISELRILIK